MNGTSRPEAARTQLSDKDSGGPSSDREREHASIAWGKWAARQVGHRGTLRHVSALLADWLINNGIAGTRDAQS